MPVRMQSLTITKYYTLWLSIWFFGRCVENENRREILSVREVVLNVDIFIFIINNADRTYRVRLFQIRILL